MVWIRSQFYLEGMGESAIEGLITYREGPEQRETAGTS